MWITTPPLLSENTYLLLASQFSLLTICYNVRMKIKANENCALVRFECGEELISLLVGMFSGTEARSGSFTLIGATSSIELGFYSLEKKAYHWKIFNGEYELTGGIGNISFFEGSPVVHLHTTIADSDFNAYGGHVRKLIVGATCEVTIDFHKETLIREPVPEIGLNLWKL